MDYELWINEAIAKVQKLENGKIFILKDLFMPTDWNDLTPGSRRELGRRFKNEVNVGAIPNLTIIENTKNSSTTYQKN